jgi:hypothetical protein
VLFLDAPQLAPYLAPRVEEARYQSDREEATMELDDLTCAEVDERLLVIKELASQAAHSATTEEERQGVQDVIELVEEVIAECAEALEEHAEALRAINRAFAQPRS